MTPGPRPSFIKSFIRRRPLPYSLQPLPISVWGDIEYSTSPPPPPPRHTHICPVHAAAVLLSLQGKGIMTTYWIVGKTSVATERDSRQTLLTANSVLLDDDADQNTPAVANHYSNQNLPANGIPHITETSPDVTESPNSNGGPKVFESSSGVSVPGKWQTYLGEGGVEGGGLNHFFINLLAREKEFWRIWKR